jgi:hypothetical protein
MDSRYHRLARTWRGSERGATALPPLPESLCYIRAIDVRLLRKSGQHVLALSLTAFDPERTMETAIPVTKNQHSLATGAM